MSGTEIIWMTLSSPITWAVVFLTQAYLLYRYMTSAFNYFSDQGIPGPKPLPVIGNLWGIWKSNLVEYDMKMVKKYGKVIGYFDGLQPNLWITDTDLIKSIFVKDFDHFVDRRHVDFKNKVIRKWLTLLNGQEWKDVRSSVSPAFTTGKIKRMSNLIKECVDKLAKKFEASSLKEGKIDAKVHFSALTMDVIARCAFGMDIANLGEKDDPFVRNAQFVMNPPTNKSPLILLPFVFPKFFSLIGERFFVTKEFLFFVDTLTNVLRERATSQQEYHDFIAVATEAISSVNKTDEDGQTSPMWSKEEVEEIVAAQSSLFMLAGFDTTATTLTNSCFQLARNPDIQEKLYECVMKGVDEFGDITHEMVQDIPYVEQFLNEVLRYYPPAVRIERLCTKDITYSNVHIKKGTIVTVPTFPLHFSEENYPDPEKFDPDRWSAENKCNRNPYAFMGFGMGPRNCVGMRFAMEELKITLCSIVKQFRFFPVDETPDKIKFEDGFVTVLQPVHTIVGIEQR